MPPSSMEVDPSSASMEVEPSAAATTADGSELDEDLSDYFSQTGIETHLGEAVRQLSLRRCASPPLPSSALAQKTKHRGEVTERCPGFG